MAGARVVGKQVEPLAIDLGSFFNAADGVQHRTQVAVRICRLRCETHGLAMGVQGFFHAVKAAQRISQILPRCRMIRFQPYHLTKRGDRGFQISSFAPDGSQIVECVGIPGAQVQRASVVRFCLVKAMKLLEHVAPVVEGIGVVGHQGKRLSQQLQGLLGTTQLMFGHTKKVQGVDLVGRGGQQRAIPSRGLFNVAFLMLANRHGQAVADYTAVATQFLLTAFRLG